MIYNPHGSILPLQRAYFYGFRPKNVRFCIGGRTVLGRRTYGFGTETVKRSLLHAEIPSAREGFSSHPSHKGIRCPPNPNYEEKA